MKYVIKQFSTTSRKDSYMNTDKSKALTIGELAKLTAVNIETVRFYQRRCLMTEPLRPSGGIRRYNDNDAARISFI